MPTCPGHRLDPEELAPTAANGTAPAAARSPSALMVLDDCGGGGAGGAAIRPHQFSFVQRVGLGDTQQANRKRIDGYHRADPTDDPEAVICAPRITLLPSRRTNFTATY